MGLNLISILISTLLLSNSAQAQTIINDTATLRTAVNTDVVPNNERLITAAKLNRILNGYLNVLAKQIKVDTAYALGDTAIRFVKNGHHWDISVVVDTSIFRGVYMDTAVALNDSTTRYYKGNASWDITIRGTGGSSSFDSSILRGVYMDTAYAINDTTTRYCKGGTCWDVEIHGTSFVEIDSIFSFHTDSIVIGKKLRIPLTDTTHAKKGCGNIIYDTINEHYYGDVCLNGSHTNWACFDCAGLSSVAWGDITGTLSDQTDLQAALDAKQDQLSGTGFVKASGTTISYDNATYVPTSRTITINGTTYDLSTDRSWTISGLSTALTDSHIYVGNGINVATDVALSGDGSLANTGALTVTGLRTKALPSLSAGFLTYTGSAWAFDNSTYLTSNQIITLGGDVTGSGSTSITTALAIDRQRQLIPTAVKTTNYSAAANDFVPCDNTSGSFTVTLPSAPADRTVAGVKIVKIGRAHV